MITLYQQPNCPYALRTRIVLEEKQLAYEPRMVDRANKPREVLDVSPRGTSPVYYDEQVKLRESLVICEYLDERHPAPPMMPATAAERAQVRLTLVSLEDLEDAGSVLLHARLGVTPADADALNEAQQTLARELTRIDGVIGAGPFVCGSALTLADVALFCDLVAGVTLLGRDAMLGGHANLARWFDSLRQRPAVARALARANG